MPDPAIDEVLGLLESDENVPHLAELLRGGFFLLVSGYHISDDLYGAWIDSPRGPLELATGFHRSEEAVVSLRRLIQRAALKA